MAIHAAPPVTEPLARSLTVLEGGRRPDKRTAREEALVEAMAFCDEVERAAALIVDAIAGLPVPSAHAMNEAYRMAHRARKAGAELRLLANPDGAA